MTLRDAVRYTHVGFSDESCHNINRYRSIAMVSLPYSELSQVKAGLERLLRDASVTEFKFAELNGVKKKQLALAMCVFAVTNALQGKLGIDVLSWDTEDSRHKVRRRDDDANLQRMYYHLFHYVLLQKKWSNANVWMLCPDEISVVNWGTIKNCLEKSRAKTLAGFHLSPGSATQMSAPQFAVDIIPVVSASEPLVQLADLFAGLARFSRELTSNERELSRSDLVRRQVLDEFVALCTRNNMGVSFRARQGLRTYEPARPINFWPYTPQHPMDKAPTKKPRSPNPKARHFESVSPESILWPKMQDANPYRSRV